MVWQFIDFMLKQNGNHLVIVGDFTATGQTCKISTKVWDAPVNLLDNRYCVSELFNSLFFNPFLSL